MNDIDIKVKIAPEWLTKIGVLKQIDIDKEKDYSAIIPKFSISESYCSAS